MISPKREIDETVIFWNFHKLFTNKFSVFSWHFGTPFRNGKNERSKWQGKWNMLQWLSFVYIVIGEVN